MIGRLEITSNIPEINFMESILNMTGSGCDMTFGISLYALAHSWHIDDFIYYNVLIDEVKKTLNTTLANRGMEDDK